MSSDIENVEEIDNKFQHAFETDSAGGKTSNVVDSTALKNKFKQDSSSRKDWSESLKIVGFIGRCETLILMILTTSPQDINSFP